MTDTYRANLQLSSIPLHIPPLNYDSTFKSSKVALLISGLRFIMSFLFKVQVRSACYFPLLRLHIFPKYGSQTLTVVSFKI